MPQIPVNSPLGYIGVFLLLLGFILILAGLEILKIKQAFEIEPGRKTWIFGIVLVVVGGVFLLPDISKLLPQSLVATDTAVTAVSTPTYTPVSSTDTSIPEEPNNTSAVEVANTPTPEPTSASTLTPKPTDTSIPTNTPRPTATPTATIDADLTVYDNFNNPAFDGGWNSDLWQPWNTDQWQSGTHSGCNAIQEKGYLILSCTEPDSQHTLNARRSNLTFDDFDFIEAKVMLDSQLKTKNGNAGIGFYTSEGDFWVIDCGIRGSVDNSMGTPFCFISPPLESIAGPPVEYDTWHTIRIQVNPNSMKIQTFIDGQQFATHIPENANELKQAKFNIHLTLSQVDGTLTTGYIDDVRIGKQE